MTNKQIFTALIAGKRIIDNLGNEWYLSKNGDIASTRSSELNHLFYGLTCKIKVEANVE